MDTISVSTDAILMPFRGENREANLIHCPDIPVGTEVEVEIDGAQNIKAKVGDFSERYGTDTYLAIPPTMFPNVDINDDEQIAGMVAHGSTVHAKVIVTNLPDKDKQLMIDFYMSGKTETTLDA